MTKFYDTNAILNLGEKVLADKFYISLITLRELEYIKTCSNKDNEIKYKARKAVHMLSDMSWSYEVVLAPSDDSTTMSNDTKIIEAAKYLQKKEKIDDLVFITDDLCCKILAEAAGLQVRTTGTVSDCESYLGFRELNLTEEELSEFYSCKDAYMCKVCPEILQNEYFFIKTGEEVIDIYRRVGDEARRIMYPVFESDFFGNVKPKDDYQRIAMDSMINNQITMIGGKPGSGKTFLALGYLFQELEKNHIDRIVIFCNPIVARHAAKLGYLPGTAREKILGSQVGNVLASKLGSMFAVEKLIEDGKIVLIPAGDARGYQVPEYSGVYILESQNLDVELMKLILQRIGENSKVIVDGDHLNSQVDLDAFAGLNNGMRKCLRSLKEMNASVRLYYKIYIEAI